MSVCESWVRSSPMERTVVPVSTGGSLYVFGPMTALGGCWRECRHLPGVKTSLPSSHQKLWDTNSAAFRHKR
jgi:hypothetical protein